MLFKKGLIMSSLVQKIYSDKLVKRVFTLFTGSAAGTMILFLFQPLITRIYTPLELGVYAFIFSIVTMFSSVINGHYELIIVSAEDDEEADKIAILSLAVGGGITIIIALAIIIVQLINPSILQEAGWWTLTACLFLLVLSINNILSSYNNRYLQYKII